MDVNVLPSINKGSLLYFTLLYFTLLYFTLSKHSSTLKRCKYDADGLILMKIGRLRRISVVSDETNFV